MANKFDRQAWLDQIMGDVANGIDPEEAPMRHPDPGIAPSNNLSSLPDQEIAEWLGRWQNGMLH